MEEYIMIEYVKGKAMYAYITSPNIRWNPPHKYEITVLTDDETATRLEDIGIQQTRTKQGQPRFDQPAFVFKKNSVKSTDNTPLPRPKLIDADGNALDTIIGNGSDVVVKVKPYSFNGGTYGELVAVKVENLVEYGEVPEDDNEEF